MKPNTGKKLWSALVVAALIISSFYISGNVTKIKAASYGLSNPTIKKNVVISGDDSPKEEGTLRNPVVKATVTTWDCIYFGNYWQNDTNGDGTVDQNDEKEPIKWRVLSVDGDDAFLLADQNLDCQPYNEENADVTWESCTLRRWLNSSFLSNAFSAEEQSAIKETTVVNKANSTYVTVEGNDTNDKVYLLSLDEVTNAAYGFHGKFDSYSETREAKNTAFAKECGAWTCSDIGIEENGVWWLRSRSDNNCALDMGCTGGIYDNSTDYREYVAVRPVLHINLSSTCWKNAGNATGKDHDSTTWDCVYFGNYWQNDTNDDAKINQSDEKQPIKWRVLSVDNDDIFLLADQNLDSRSYDDEETVVTWETCTLRNWLNNTFLTNAFSEKEQGGIKNTTVVNEDNPTYGTEGGNDTIDKIYLLSEIEACNVSYGFNRIFSYEDGTREAQNTAYSIECGANTFSETGHEGTGVWWLRTPGGSSYCATVVDFYGEGARDGSPVSSNSSYYKWYKGYKVYSDSIAVRPVLHISRSSSLWKSAGTVTADSQPLKDIIVGETDRSTGFWTAFSEPYKLEDGKTLTIEFNNYGFGGVDVWNNYQYVLHNEEDISKDIRTENYKEYAVVRADNFGWSDAGQNVSVDGTNIQYEMSMEVGGIDTEWGNITKNCRVVSKFTRSGKQVKIDSTITNLDDASKSYTRRIVVSTHKTDPVYITLTCEKAYLVLKDVKTSSLVRYNANGGTGAPSSQTKYDGEPLTISNTEPTRSGYTFLGWSTDSKATVASYLSGDSYILDGVVTLYAVWKRDEIPTPTPTLTPTATPESTPTITPTATPAPTPDNRDNSSGGSNNSNTDVKTPEKPSLKPKTPSIKVGKIIKKGSLKYKVTKISGKSGKVSIVSGTNKKLKKIVIPQSIKVNGVIFKITAIEKNAFKNYKKLSFLSIKSKTITKIGKNALKGTKKKIKIMVPTSKLKKYKKMIKKAR